MRADAESLTSSSPKAKFILKPVDHEMATPWSEHQYGGSGRDDAIPRREAVTDYTLMMQQQDVLAWCFFFCIRSGSGHVTVVLVALLHYRILFGEGASVYETRGAYIMPYDAIAYRRIQKSASRLAQVGFLFLIRGVRRASW